MNIHTEDDCLGTDFKSLYSKKFVVLKYQDGSQSLIPHGMFRNWLDEDISNQNFHDFYIGRCSGLGTGTVAKYDKNLQALKIGRYVAGGQNLRFVLNGQHAMDSISICMFGVFSGGMRNATIGQYKDIVIKNDIWIGDEAMFLGGSTIENGCVVGARTLIPPNFVSEPYGIYVGTPARLVRFRFSEKIREMLLILNWWDMPIDWLRSVNNQFLLSLANMEEALALDILQGLLESKKNYLDKKGDTL